MIPEDVIEIIRAADVSLSITDELSEVCGRHFEDQKMRLA